MRFCVTVTLICVVTLSIAAQDHLATLGITEGRAKEAVFDSFMSDAVSIAGKPAAFTAMAPTARVALVNFALAMARTFVESDEFKRRYVDHREANGPDPLPEAQTEQRATLEAGWTDMRRQLDEMEKGERRTEIEGLLKEQRDKMVRERNAAMIEFEKTYPADSRALVAMRLRHFLDVTKDVDFTAQLVEKGKIRVFASEALEAKPAEWKMCFRAGKPPTDAARAFAQKWLNDLQAQGLK